MQKFFLWLKKLWVEQWPANNAGEKTISVGVSIPLSTGYRNEKEKEMFEIHRFIFTDKSTIGEFFVRGEFFCWSLEDTCRKPHEDKVKHHTAIPPGRYEVVIHDSYRWKETVPWLLDVPGFTNIQIHPGNTNEDTSGCILVGMRKGVNRIFDSRKAFGLLKNEMAKQVAFGPVYLSVVGGR